MRAPIALVILLSFLHVGEAWAASPCPDLQDMACRDRFIDANMPTPHKPTAKDLQDPSKLALSKELHFLIASLQALDGPKRIVDADVRQATKDGDNDGLAEATKKQAAIQQEIYAKSNRAIADAIQLYGLAPKITTPVTQGGSGNAAPMKDWRPHFGEFDMSGNRIDRGDLRMVAGTNPLTANMTLFPGSFSSEEQLTASIYHETVHWLNDTALGRETTPFEDFSNEVLAYKKEIAAQRSLGLSASQVAALEAPQSHYERLLKIVKPTDTWTRLRVDHPEIQPSSSMGAPAETNGMGDAGEDAKHLADSDFGKSEGEMRESIDAIAAAKAHAAECRAVDANISRLLIDIVKKACGDPENFTDEDVRPLNGLPDNESYTCSAEFPHSYYPVSQLNSSCQRPLFDNLWNRLVQRSWFHASTVLSVLKSREGFPTPLEGAPPSLSIPAAADTTVEIAHLNSQVQYMQSLVRWACANNGRFSEDSGSGFRKAYRELRQNSTHSGGIPDLGPDSALSGLGGCARDLMIEFLKYPENDLNNNARSTLERYYPAPNPPPTPAPAPNLPDPRPERPRPRPRPGDPCRDNGNIRCP